MVGAVVPPALSVCDSFVLLWSLAVRVNAGYVPETATPPPFVMLTVWSGALFVITRVLAGVSESAIPVPELMFTSVPPEMSSVNGAEAPVIVRLWASVFIAEISTEFPPEIEMFGFEKPSVWASVAEMVSVLVPVS